MPRSTLRRSRRLLLSTLPVVIVLTLPAQADAFECEQFWERSAHVARQESRAGLTLERLDEINLLITFLEECAADGLVGPWMSGVGRWGPLVAVYFGPEDVERVLCLMELESAGDPGAKNPTSGAAGLMQVMPFWAGHFGYSSGALFDPHVNLKIAAWIRDQQGWSAWSPYVRGLCH